MKNDPNQNNKFWKNPNLLDIAHAANVGTATVDRVLHNRSGVSDKTRQKVYAALTKLKIENEETNSVTNIALICDSGISFNQTLENTVKEFCISEPNINFTTKFITTSEADPFKVSKDIEQMGLASDGLILVTRDHPALVRSVRKVTDAGIPVICMTTDISGAFRSAYVGVDQVGSGATAAYLLGRLAKVNTGRILLVLSLPFRSQQEREIGFRRVLRSEFPHLKVDEKISSNDVPIHTYKCVERYIEENGPPDAIYNVAGGNSGIGRSLVERDIANETLFIGHELNNSSKRLLEDGTMDLVISHPFSVELRTSVELIKKSNNGQRFESIFTNTLVHTKFNCT